MLSAAATPSCVKTSSCTLVCQISQRGYKASVQTKRIAAVMKRIGPPSPNPDPREPYLEHSDRYYRKRLWRREPTAEEHEEAYRMGLRRVFVPLQKPPYRPLEVNHSVPEPTLTELDLPDRVHQISARQATELGMNMDTPFIDLNVKFKYLDNLCHEFDRTIENAVLSSILKPADAIEYFLKAPAIRDDERPALYNVNLDNLPPNMTVEAPKHVFKFPRSGWDKPKKPTIKYREFVNTKNIDYWVQQWKKRQFKIMVLRGEAEDISATSSIGKGLDDLADEAVWKA